MAPHPTRSQQSATYHLPATTPGALPGTLVACVGAKQPVIKLIAYDGERIVEKQITDVQEISQYLGQWQVVWVNVEGLGCADTVGQIGDLFKIHRLALEDVMHTHQRAKLEQYGENFFIILQMMDSKQIMQIDQLSIFFGPGFVITFQQEPAGCMESVKERLRGNLGRLRSSNADYLMYALIDCVVDGYFPVLEIYGEKLESLEEEIIDSASRSSIAALHDVKRELLTLRRTMWPIRETINSLLRDAPSMVAEETRIHLRDCYDHCVQIIDFIETYRELGSDLMDVYLSSISNRMNEVMKVLTIITTLFVPPTFIAGIYGMNFHHEVSPYNMPELNYYYGYPICLGVMLMISLAILALLWWKGWLSALSRTSSRPNS